MADATDNVIKLEIPRLEKPDDARTLSQKWGKEVMAANYTVIPCALLRGQLLRRADGEGRVGVD